MTKLEIMQSELIAVQEEYIRLISHEYDAVGTMAYVHGYRCADAIVDKGDELRAKIIVASNKINQLQDGSKNNSSRQ